MSGGASRVSSVKETIQNIREIAGNHSDDEIYAMLKECSMDPNETAQKLLLQDTFHEVRRKRDKKKEIPTNRESTDSRWRPGTQGRGGRGSRGSYSHRYVAQDTGIGKSVNTGKVIGGDKGVNVSPMRSPLSASQDTESKVKAPASSSVTVITNGPSSTAGKSFGRDRSFSRAQPLQLPTGGGAKIPRDNSAVTINKLGTAAPSPPVDANTTSVSGTNRSLKQPRPSSDQLSASPASVSGVYSPGSDPVLLPSFDSRIPGAVGTIKREVGSQRAATESKAVAERKSTVSRSFTDRVQANKIAALDVTNSDSSSAKTSSETGNSFIHGKMPGKPEGVEKNQHSGSSRPSSSTHDGLSTRPSSNYSSRSQQPIGSQKVGPNKEWKPKSASLHPAPPSQLIGMYEGSPVTLEVSAPSLTTSNASASEEAMPNLQKNLEELQFSDGRHVIIPKHLHVPEAERSRLSFGSFDASFGVSTSSANVPDNDKSSTSLSESSREIEETLEEEPSSSNQSASPNAQEGDYLNHPQSPQDVAENVSAGEAIVSTNSIPEYDSYKLEAAVPSVGPQYSVVHTAHYSNFGYMPPVIGTQFTSFDSSDAQSRDVSRLSSYFVPQPFVQFASYYNPFYRPDVDADGCFFPLITPGAATKYNGNMALLLSQSGQSPQEGGNSVVLSTAAPTPLVTQAAGIMQSSIPITPQQVPFLRPPAGIHLSPYSSYFPYAPPFLLPPPNFLSNAAFPQQAPAGNLYQAHTAAAATGVKLSLPQYKPGTNAGHSTYNGMQTSYGPYPTGANYGPSSAATAGNSTGNEDLAASQYKDNNVYITGQQREGSTVWIPTTAQEISGLHASSFYNLPQTQHLAYAPTQAGHGTFTGIYHPSQAVPTTTVHQLLQHPQTMAGNIEMAGPTTGVYQQTQRTQMNWNNNY